MRLLSEASFREIEDRRARLSRRCRDLESELQTLKLLLGYRGLHLETEPEIPATPARLVLRKVARGE